MKFRRSGALIMAAILSMTCCAYARAVRTDPKKNAGVTDRRKPNDIIFQDFNSTEGSLPEGVSSSGGTGTVTVEKYDVGKKLKKGCLVLNDTSHTNEYTGVKAVANVGEQKGLVGVEVRYMYDLEEGSGSTYACMLIELFDKAGKVISESVIGSGDGFTRYNVGGTGQKNIETAKILPNTWYTVKWIIDFDKREADYILLNEGTNTRTTLMNADFYSAETGGELAKVSMKTSVHGGKYVYDYIRISSETARLEELESANIKKGVEQVKIEAPASAPRESEIAISMDGRYKYTTVPPYEKDGKVMVTAKNLAGFFNIGYDKSKNVYTLDLPTGKLSIKTGAKNEVTGNKKELLTLTEESGGQLFVPIQDICDILGYKCEYDSEKMTVTVTCNDAEGEKEANSVEK